LEDEWRDTRGAHDHMRRMSGAKPSPFRDPRRRSRAQRSENGRQGGLAATVLRVTNHQFRELDCAGIHRVELTDVAHQLNALDHCD